MQELKFFLKKFTKKISENGRISVAGVLLCALMIATSLAASARIWSITEDDCLSILQDVAEQEAKTVRTVMQSEESRMQTIADMLGDHTTLNEETCLRYINTLDTSGIVSGYSVLLPDGTMLYSDGAGVTWSGHASFAEESENGAYFSDRFEADDGSQYAAYVLPVRQDGEVKCILYGYVSMETLADSFEYTAYDGQCQLYLVDGENGDFLIDTWHDTLGNLHDDNLSGRKMKHGSFEQANEDIANGQAGYMVFVSKTTGDDFFIYYTPVGWNNLSIQITVARSVAFESADHIQRVVFALCGGLVLGCILYIGYSLRRTHKELFENRKRMELGHAVEKIQQSLLSAYKNPWLIGQSLGTLSKTLEASHMLFISLDDDSGVDKMYGYPVLNDEKRHMIRAENLRAALPDIARKSGENYAVLRGPAYAELMEKAYRALDMGSETLQSLTAAWVTDAEKDIVGVLYAANVPEPEKCAETLELVANSLQMSVQTISTYHLIQQIGEMDALTGLKNRNAYQRDLAGHEHKTDVTLCCIYADANGLHELNNNYGHEAGDEMLRSVATALKEQFGAEAVYRIGGDEFVILAEDIGQEAVKAKMAAAQQALDAHDYHVSMGMAFRKPEQRMSQTIQEAEQGMYAAKRAFYEGRKDRRGSNRNLNQKLENLLMEKKNQDAFLAAIAPYFLGVYIVNLDSDDTRIIFKTEHFAEMLDETGYNYHGAILLYAKRFVAANDFDGFIRLLDYEKLAREFGEGRTVEHYYHRKDGEYVRVRIVPASDYSKEKRNTLWIFEQPSAQQD